MKLEKLVVRTLLVLLFSLGTFYLTKFLLQDYLLEKRAGTYIKRIEDYRQKNGKLPVSFDELGIDDHQIYYRSDDPTNYIVWFGIGVGESETYRSSEKQWRP